MSRKIIELVQVLVDRIEKNGYQQRAREENAFDLNKRLTEAEGWVAHWKQARQEAHEAGELMKAEIETLRKELDAANAAVALQRAGIERLQAFVNLSRRLLGVNMNYADVNRLRAGLAELDAGTMQPAPVAEPVPCRERGLSEEMQDAVPPSWAPLVWDLRRRLRESQQARGHELERLSTCVGKVRTATLKYQPWSEALNQITAALAELDAGTEPTPVAEPIDAEGGA